MDFQSDYVIIAVIALIAVTVFMYVIRHGGFKGALFGAGIKNTVGEVLINNSRWTKFTIRIHNLDSAPDRAVGVELVAKSAGSYHVTPVAMSKSETRNLIELLDKAVS